MPGLGRRTMEQNELRSPALKVRPAISGMVARCGNRRVKRSTSRCVCGTCHLQDQIKKAEMFARRWCSTGTLSVHSCEH